MIDLTQVAYVQYDDAGRVELRGVASNHAVDLFVGMGRQILRLKTTPDLSMSALASQADYVDLSGDAPALTPRPEWTAGFDADEVLSRELATVPGLPACTVRFTGPTSGAQEHPGGDLAIGFSTPGVYAVEFEAFPYLPAKLELTVRARETKPVDLGGIQL